MKPADVKSSTYFDFNKESDKEDPKFEAGDHVRKSKYKNIFAKRYIPHWSEEAFMIKKVKKYGAVDICYQWEEIVGTFYKNYYKKTNQKEFTVEKVIKRKSDKLYVKSKDYVNSFNS